MESNPSRIGSSSSPATEGSSHWLSHGRVVLLLVGSAALLDLALRLVEVLRPGHLLGVVQYDDSVYLGAAVRILAGALPYRDFILIQPPGLPLILTPIAAVGRLVGVREAMGLARLLVPVVAAVDVVVLGFLLRRRSPLVVGVGCFALAAYPDDLLSAQTVYQEPFLNLLCLLGAVLAFDGDSLVTSRRRLFLAGVAFGLAGAVKVWAIFPLLILVLLLWRTPARSVGLIAGAGAGFLVVCAPFLVLSAPAFVHQVLISQAERTDVARVPLTVRIAMMTGVVITNVAQVTDLQRKLGLSVAALMAAFLAVAFCLVPRPDAVRSGARERWWARRRTTPLERYALGAALLVAVVMLIPDDFYFHYATFLGPFLVLALALAAGRLEPLLPQLAVGAATLVLLGALGHAALVARGVGPAPDPAAAIDRLLPKGACVVTDNPAYLINADRYQGGPGCPPVVDPFGVTIATAGGRVAQGGAAGEGNAVATWRRYFRRAGYLLLTPASGVRIPWDPGLEAYVHAHFRLVSSAPVLILRRASGGRAGGRYSLKALAGA